MDTQQFIWLSCFMGAVMSFSFSNIQSNSIDASVQLGQFINIGPDVVIEAGSRVDSFAGIQANTHIGGNSRIGSYSHIGQRCNIANNVNIGQFSKLASGVVIGSDSAIDGFNKLSDGVKIGNRVRLNQYSTVGNNARIGDDSISNKFSSIGANAELLSKAYLGSYSSVDPSVTVGESAVVHNFVEIDRNVKPKEVVIRTPSSYDLYQSYAQDVPAEKQNIADRRTNGAISPEFNSMLLQMIETDLNTLRTNCAQGGNGQSRPALLPEIISLYLIQYHGLQRFNEIKQQIYSISDSSLLWQLQHEYHLGNDSSKNILEPNVKQKLIQLLAIDQDAQRNERVVYDTFCKMLQDILSGERDVICAKPILTNLP